MRSAYAIIFASGFPAGALLVAVFPDDLDVSPDAIEVFDEPELGALTVTPRSTAANAS